MEAPLSKPDAVKQAETLLKDKDIESNSTGFNITTKSYARLEDAPESERVEVKKLFEELRTTYGQRMYSLIRQADNNPKLYKNRAFKKHLAAIATHLGHIHDRLHEYEFSEHFFLVAILHEKNMDKKSELYTSLVISLKDEYSQKHTAVPQYQGVVAQLLQEIFMRNKESRGDAKLINAFLALPLTPGEKLEILKKMTPGSDFLCHHKILMAYMYMLLKRPFMAKELAFAAFNASKNAKLSQALTDILSKTIAYINDTAKKNQQ